ncbi:hypothetical protein M9458_051974 [Cirrhinus mrigala]|uniref:Uncharacterized protein n=1 Tax=Cirrhinus mrigala TaxID=683832 RepID=A0ABD0MUL1_CIRMR
MSHPDEHQLFTSDEELSPSSGSPSSAKPTPAGPMPGSSSGQTSKNRCGPPLRSSPNSQRHRPRLGGHEPRTQSKAQLYELYLNSQSGLAPSSAPPARCEAASANGSHSSAFSSSSPLPLICSPFSFHEHRTQREAASANGVYLVLPSCQLSSLYISLSTVLYPLHVHPSSNPRPSRCHGTTIRFHSTPYSNPFRYGRRHGYTSIPHSS